MINYLRNGKKDEKLIQDFLNEYGGNQSESLSNTSSVPKNVNTKELEAKVNSYSFEDGAIVGCEDGVIDASSPEAIAKYLHNMRILMNDAKGKGKVEDFYLIREDDYFPKGWEWNVLSDQTNLEPVRNSFSFAIRKQYALDKAGLSEKNSQFGIHIPMISDEEEKEALAQVPLDIADIMLPSHFRSTKHFTLSTPLGVTGDYNAVKTGRNFIVFDKPDNLIKSGYAYSMADHDVYGDVSHEPIKISNDGFVLIDDEKYESLMQDEEIKQELEGKTVFRYKGDPTTAIAMALASHGALPTKCILPEGIRSETLSYDSDLRDIMENSIKDMARENGLFYDKSHAGKLSPEGGHFSNYYDDKNKDHFYAITEFVAFLREKFPEHAELLPEFLRLDHRDDSLGRLDKIIERIGAQNLIEAIGEYNAKTIEKMDQSFKNYKEERRNITPEMHDKFVGTIAAINDYYKTPDAAYNYDIEPSIQTFLQGKSVKEQSEAADEVLAMLGITKNALSDKRVGFSDLEAARSVEEVTQTKDTLDLENEVYTK